MINVKPNTMNIFKNIFHKYCLAINNERINDTSHALKNTNVSVHIGLNIEFSRYVKRKLNIEIPKPMRAVMFSRLTK